jgi:hypothetical protein
MAQLTALAEAHQASISAETLKLYASRLVRYSQDDILTAIDRLMFVKPGDDVMAVTATPLSGSFVLWLELVSHG